MEEREPSIPVELEDILFKYTKKAIRDHPEDFISHAADYFNRLRDGNKEKNVSVDEGSKEHIAKVLGPRVYRRGTVMGERYNPEEDDDEDEIEVIPKTDEQKKRILSQCEGIFLFRVLDKTDLEAVIDAMMLKPVEEGQKIIKQGDDGDYFYLIDNGKFEAYVRVDEEDKLVTSYDGKGFFGELALLHNQPRAATVKATTKGLLYAVSRKTFNKLIVKRAFQKRQLYMELLDGLPQLKPLTEYEKMQVADALEARSYETDETIFEEGDEGDGMYFIVEGKVSVRQKTSSGEYEEIAQLEKNEYFGELALVKHQPRAATLVALEDTKAAFLDVQAFERLLGPCLDIMKRHTETYDKKK